MSSYVSRDLFYNSMPHTNKYTSIWTTIVNMKGEMKELDRQLTLQGYQNLSYYADEQNINYNDPTNNSQDNFLITYADHAWTSGWINFDVYTLRNNKAWLNSPIMISEGCGTCAFDKSLPKDDLFCANVIRRGAIAYFGATTDASGTNWDPLQMFYNEMFQNVDVGNASRDVRNRAIPVAYPISTYGNSLGPYDTWDLLIGDPAFNPKLNLHYGSTDTVITNQTKSSGNEFVYKLILPASKRNVNATTYYYSPDYGSIQSLVHLYEYPVGEAASRFYTYEYYNYNMTGTMQTYNNLIYSGCWEGNEYSFSFNVPSGTNISSIKNITYSDGNKEFQLNYMSVYCSQQVQPYFPIFPYIKYYKDSSRPDSYYVYFDESLSCFPNIVFCNTTSLPARNYTITFNMSGA